jgi:molecular chaperone GrpE
MNGQTDRPEEELEDESVNDGANDAESSEQEETPEAAMAELKARADDNWDRYLRAAAETENVRKRASRDVEHARKYALEGFGTEMLAVKDSLELGLEAVESADDDSIAEGSKATLKLISAALERFGIEEIDPMGEPFDPERHEAINMQPSADAEPGSVLSVVQKGYSLNGRLLRPAMVVVAAEPLDESPDKSASD